MPKKSRIRQIIEGEFVTARYQPIISLKRKTLIGFEGMARGIDPQSKELLPPQDLFSEATHERLNLPLDRLCRKKVLEEFKPIQEAHPKMILNLNFDPSVLDEGVLGSGNLIQMVRTVGLNPSNICIEIIESHVDNAVGLQKFVDTYRRHGFLIALDDADAGHSNLNRIPVLKPDIMKVGRYLIQEIQDNFYKQQIFKSLVFMGHALGTLVIAEGVETKMEALTVLQLGADMIQGYYFAKPMEPHDCLHETYSQKIADLALAFKTKEIQKDAVKRIHYTKHHSMIGEIQYELSQVSVVDFDLKLERITDRFPNVECFYVLDDYGIQVSKTFFNDSESFHHNRMMFHPAPKGTDHTMKDYFYMLTETGIEKMNFVTEPYLSMASGNMCVTISTRFHDALQKGHILCVDIRVQDSIR